MVIIRKDMVKELKMIQMTKKEVKMKQIARWMKKLIVIIRSIKKTKKNIQKADDSNIYNRRFKRLAEYYNYLYARNVEIIGQLYFNCILNRSIHNKYKFYTVLR